MIDLTNGVASRLLWQVQPRAPEGGALPVQQPMAGGGASPADIVRVSLDQRLKSLLAMLDRHIEAEQLALPQAYLGTRVEIIPAAPGLTPQTALAAELQVPLPPQRHLVEVLSLAYSEVVASDSVSSLEGPLGLTGIIVVGRQPLLIEPGDSIAAIAVKITTQGEVMATVEPDPDGKPRLVLTATEAAVAGPGRLAVKNGPAAEPLVALGIHGPQKVPAQIDQGWVRGEAFPSRSEPVSTMAGLPRSANLAVTVFGKPCPVNLGTDSLERIARSINRRLPESLSAAVEPASEGRLGFRLTLPAAALREMGDNDNVLELLGLLRRVPRHPLAEGKEAVLLVNGRRVASPTNRIDSAVAGLTLSLAGTNQGEPLQVAVTPDAKEIARKIALVIEDVNRILNALESQPSPAAPTAVKPPGEKGLQQLKEALLATLLMRVPGNTEYQSPETVGIRLSQGLLNLDTPRLEAALGARPEEAARLLRSVNTQISELVNLYIDPRAVMLADLREPRLATEEAEGEASGDGRAFVRERGRLDDRLATIQAFLERSRELCRRLVLTAHLEAPEDVIEAEIVEDTEEGALERSGAYSSNALVPLEDADASFAALEELGPTEPEDGARLAALFALTRRALNETDAERFIDLLRERDALVGMLLNGEIGVNEERAGECVVDEQRIIDRLESEKTRVLEAMEQLSMAWKAQRRYASSFPLPPMPAFFPSS